jgi:hypothetical protein
MVEGFMGRIFGFLSLVVGLGVGMYLYSRQVQTTSAATGAATPGATVNIAGVKTDLMTMAAAERRYFATEGKYVSLDELISSGYITVARQRPPYSYAIQVGAGGFRVVATRSGEGGGGLPAQVSVDENMEFQGLE